MSDPRTMRVLYIDNDPMPRELFARAVESQGYDVECVADGEAGLARFAEARFDLVATEQDLPDIDGIGVIRMLLSSEPRLPVLMITGVGNEELAIEVLSLEMGGYVIKDAARTYLERAPLAVAALLDRSAARQRRSEAEHALEESELRYRRLVDASPVCIHEIDLDGRLSSINPAGLRMMGARNESDVCGLKYLDIPVAEDRERVSELMDRARAGTGSTFEFSAAGQDGTLYFASSFEPIRNGDGKVVKLMGVTEDITDRKTAELERRAAEHELQKNQEEMRRVNELNRQASEIGRLGHWLWNNDNGKCVWFSESLPLLRGMTAAEYRERVRMLNIHRDNVHRADRDAIDEADRQAGVSPYTIEYRAYLPNGDERWFREIGEPYFVEDGDISYSIGTTQDITAEKLAERKLEEAMALLKANDKAKSNFLATMSHELRTPLNAILGFSELLAGEGYDLLDELKRKEYARDIHSSGAHMLSLINDVLDLSAIEFGQRRFAFESVDLNETLRDCVKKARRAMPNPELEISLNASDDPPVVWADRRAVVQIALNLLSNAAKFTPSDGRIAVSLLQTETDTVVQVSDNGIGIPAGKLASVTEPFSQSHANPNLAQEGAGLGLSIVKALVEGHGGRLQIESEVGVGTTVRFSLPRREEQDQDDTPAMSA